MPHSTQLITPDTLVASATVHGGYWPFAAHFAAGHGATPRSTLRAQLLMRIRMAVLRPLALLQVPHTRTARSARFAFQQRAVPQMTNLCDGISYGPAAACYTDLQVCFACTQRLFGPPRHPFQLCFLFFVSLPKFYGSLPKPRQRVITRFCPTSPTVEATQRSHTTLLTTLLHSTNCKNFCRGSPQQRVSTNL